MSMVDVSKPFNGSISLFPAHDALLPPRNGADIARNVTVDHDPTTIVAVNPHTIYVADYEGNVTVVNIKKINNARTYNIDKVIHLGSDGLF